MQFKSDMFSVFSLIVLYAVECDIEREFKMSAIPIEWISKIVHPFHVLLCCDLLKPFYPVPWPRHPTETFSALLAMCAGNSPVPGEFPAQRSVTQSFDVFFDLRLNKRLSKQSWDRWFETLSRPLWRHRNAFRVTLKIIHITSLRMTLYPKQTQA